MRKFLSVILLFLLIAPAIADDQCPMGYGVLDSRFIEVTNLLNEDTWISLGDTTKDGHNFKNTVVDGFIREEDMYLQFYLNNVFINQQGPLFPAQEGWKRAIFAVPSGITYDSIRIKRNGRTQDFNAIFDMVLPPGIYTIGMEIFSDDASAVGGFEFGNIVIVEGDVVLTQYIPYQSYVELPTFGKCTLCPPNTYKDFVGNVACTPCPNRTMSPAGATSVDECGHVLHVDDYIVFMPVGRRTEHGLCTMLDGVKYCADVYEKQ